ncbi:hypothetical protein ACPYO6_09370 [Georgenia sp. Z1344]|uniref:hypothetical protein n=1 Tax=Georgenia sp. Z1344 TaxID=3416706 RepID=UPI003CF8D6CD
MTSPAGHLGGAASPAVGAPGSGAGSGVPSTTNPGTEHDDDTRAASSPTPDEPGPGTPTAGATAAHPAPSGLAVVPWRRVAVALSVVSLLVTVASYIPTRWTGGGLFYGGGEWHHIFDVALENSVATTWSTMLMTAGAVLCGLCAWLVRRQRSGAAWPWVLLGLGLAAFAVDEASSLHERLPLVVDRLGIEASITYAWLMIGIPLAIAVVVGVVVCAIRLPRSARWLMIAGILVFFAGAVGVEMLTGELRTYAPDVHNRFLSELIHSEELLELLGIGIAVCAPLSALRVTPRRADPGELHLVVATR